MQERFKNRIQAGRALASALEGYAGRKDTLVLALPRGGVPLAHEVATSLGLPMDVWLVRKLGVPGYEELAMGAIALGDTYYLNNDVIKELHVPQKAVREVIAAERKELDRRNNLYRQGAPLPDLKGQTVIIVDDGLATGATMRAAIESLRAAKAARIVVAVPVGAAATCEALQDLADELICLRMPVPFYGVGQFYEDFSQTSDEEVLAILGRQPSAKKEQRHAKE